MNETFWDAQNLEIEACANFDDFSGSGKIAVPEFSLWIGWSGGVEFEAKQGVPTKGAMTEG